MSDDAARTLWCLVEDQAAPFEVTAPGNASINQLKELIRDKGADVRFAKDLVLWKVGTF